MWISKTSLDQKMAKLSLEVHAAWSNFFFPIGFLKVSLVFWMCSSLGRWSQILSGVGGPDSLPGACCLVCVFGEGLLEITYVCGQKNDDEPCSLRSWSHSFICLFVGVRTLDKPKLISKGSAHCFSYSSHQNSVSETDFCNVNSNSCTWQL